MCSQEQTLWSFFPVIPGGVKFPSLHYVCTLLEKNNMEYAIIGETAMMYYNSRTTTENSPFRSIEIAVKYPEEAATVLEGGATRVSRLYDHDVRSFCYSGTDGYPSYSLLLHGQKVTFLPSDVYFKDPQFEFNEHQSTLESGDSEHLKDWVWTWPGKQNEHVPHMPLLAHFFLSLTHRAADANDNKAYESAKTLAQGMNLSMAWLRRAVDSYEPYDCPDVAFDDMVVSTKEILEAQEANFQLRARDGITSKDDAWMYPMNHIPGSGWYGKDEGAL